jgi:signal peptidase II
MQKTINRWPWLLVALLVIVLDWASKQWVLAHSVWGQAVKLTSFFNLRLVYNRGMAFGFLSQHAGWQVAMLTFIAIAISVLLVIWIFTAKKPTWLFLLSLPLIIGGAIGNAFDRIFHGQVVDFLDFHWVGWHFWTFNVADAAITMGVVLLLLDYVLTAKD